MAKLTQEVREELIDNLITNEGSEGDGPWSEDDREVLENMEDDKLISLDDARQESAGCQQAAAAARAGFKDPSGSSHVFNEQTGQWESYIKKPKAQPPIVNTNPQSMTDEEWLEKAPPSVKDVVNRAIKAAEEEKKSLIGQIIGNARNMTEDRVKRITTELWEESLEKLRDRVDMMPKPSVPKPSFLGASQVPVGNVGSAEQFDPSDYLPLPEIDWNEPVGAGK